MSVCTTTICASGQTEQRSCSKKIGNMGTGGNKGRQHATGYKATRGLGNETETTESAVKAHIWRPQAGGPQAKRREKKLQMYAMASRRPDRVAGHSQAKWPEHEDTITAETRNACLKHGGATVCQKIVRPIAGAHSS